MNRSETECACGAFLPEIGGTPEGGSAIGGLLWAVLLLAASIGVGLMIYGVTK